MPTTVHDFNWPDRVVVGTIGKPGQRTFYLQLRDGKQLVSIALEKEQANILAEMLIEVLDELSELEGNPYSIPEHAPSELKDTDPLEPVVELFRVGHLGLGWDATMRQVVVEFHAIIDVTSEDEGNEPALTPQESIRVRMPVGMARAFAERTDEIVAAGRPFCPNCGQPMDPEGHECTGFDQ